MKKVCIVICVYNRVDFIENCLNSVLSQDLSNYEVLVIDDGSTDGTTEFLNKFKLDKKIKVFQNKNNAGLMESRNIGARITEAEIVAYTDSDCVVQKDWLRRLIEPFSKDPDISISGGAILDPPINNYWGLVQKNLYKISDESGYVKKILGGNMAFRRVFLLENKFDETLKYGADETDLCMLAQNMGHKIYFQKEAKVVHFHRNSFAGIMRQRFALSVGNCYCRYKYKIFPLIPIANFVLFPAILVILLFPSAYRLRLFLMFFIVFSAGVFFKAAKEKKKTLKEIILTLPGMIAITAIDSIGYFYGLLKIIKRNCFRSNLFIL